MEPATVVAGKRRRLNLVGAQGQASMEPATVVAGKVNNAPVLRVGTNTLQWSQRP